MVNHSTYPRLASRATRPSAEHKQVVALGITLEALLNQQGEPLHLPAHIRVSIAIQARASHFPPQEHFRLGLFNDRRLRVVPVCPQRGHVDLLKSLLQTLDSIVGKATNLLRSKLEDVAA